MIGVMTAREAMQRAYDVGLDLLEISPNAVPPVYTCGYSDQIDAVDKDGTVPVPTGPGLGVSYDWDYIRAHKTAQQVFRL